MNVISRSTLKDFWIVHPRSETALVAWHDIASAARWGTPADVLQDFPSARAIGDDRIIFNIRNNEFRLIVRVSYTFKQAMVKFVGTHSQYDQIDNVETYR